MNEDENSSGILLGTTEFSSGIRLELPKFNDSGGHAEEDGHTDKRRSMSVQRRLLDGSKPSRYTVAAARRGVLAQRP